MAFHGLPLRVIIDGTSGRFHQDSSRARASFPAIFFQQATHLSDALFLSGITKAYGSNKVLDHFDLAVPVGQCCVMLGPSGCGKSTLLNVIAGLERFDVAAHSRSPERTGGANSGVVRIAGQDQTNVPPHRRDVAMLFQNDGLYPHLTIRQAIALVLRGRLPQDRIADRIVQVANQIGIVAFLDRLPGTLSGGQLRRAAIAKAICRQASLVLLDEPLSSLDPWVREEMMQVLLSLRQGEPAATMLQVTHDGEEAMRLADRIVVMGRGRVIQSGTPSEIFDEPVCVSVARSIGSPPTNLLKLGQMSSLFPDVASVWNAATAEMTEPILMIRPHHVELDHVGDARSFGPRTVDGDIQFAASVISGHRITDRWLVDLRSLTDPEITLRSICVTRPSTTQVWCRVAIRNVRVIQDDRNETGLTLRDAPS